MRARSARIILMALVPFIAALGLSRSRLQAGAPPKAPVSVPFELLSSNHMVIRAQLNGKGPYRLIFDLGSPVTLLSGKAATASGAIPPDAPRGFLFGVRGEGKLSKLQVGKLTAKDVPVVVMDHPAIAALSKVAGKPIEGIVGYSFFSRYRTTIDYQARQMTFVPVDFEGRDLIKDLQEKLLGPKEAKTRTLSPRGLWGLAVGDPEGGVSVRGVPITSVFAGSPAEAAGLRTGDVLMSIDGRWTVNPTDAYAAAAAIAPGSSVPVAVLRDGQEVTVSVTPAEGL